MKRRRLAFACGWATAVVCVIVTAHRAGAQTATPVQMDMGGDEGYWHVTRPPKPGARPLLNEVARDSLEHVLHCQCGGCRHDVFTCRSSDLVCSIAPQMHRDIEALITGGYSPREIVAAFRQVYGDNVLMAPPRQGFNWLGYLLPFGVILTASFVVFHLLQVWSRRPRQEKATSATVPTAVDATSDELARIREALRNDQ